MPLVLTEVSPRSARVNGCGRTPFSVGPILGTARSMTVSTGIDSLDRSIHNANAWLNDLVDELGEDRQSVYRMLRAFLHLLRDRLPPEEGAHLAAQLPHLWRGVFYEGWSPARESDTYRDRQSFLARFAEEAQLAGPTEASLAAE